MSTTQQARQLSRGAGQEPKKEQHQFDDSARNSKKSTLRVVADDTVTSVILEPRLGAFVSAHPSLSIELERQAKTGRCGRPGADLVLRYEASMLAGGEGDALHAQSLLVCAAPHYLRVRGLPHHPHDLRSTSDALVVSDDLNATSLCRFEHAGQKLSIKPKIRAITPSPSTALALAVAGVGIAQIPECWAIDEVRAGRLIRLLPEWEPTMYLRAVVPFGDLGPDARDLIQFIRTLLQPVTQSTRDRPGSLAA